MLGVVALGLALAWGVIQLSPKLVPAPTSERIGLGLALGLAASLWAPFVFALGLGLVGGAIAAMALFLVLIARDVARDRAAWRERLSRWRRPLAGVGTPDLALLAATGAFATLAGSLCYTHSLRARPGGLWTAGYAYGDLAMHATFANSFLYGGNLAPPRYPLCAGWPMSYPFVPDFQVASLTSLGLNLGAAFGLTLAVALVVLFLNVVSLARRIRSSDSVVSALVVAALFFASGGLGFWEVVAAATHGATFEQAVLARDLTNTPEDGLVLNNVVTGILVPARNAAFGMALGAAALVAALRFLDEELRPTRLAILGGALAGSLPLIHSHSFLAVGGIVLVWALSSAAPRELALKRWAWLFVPLGLVALPQVLWIRHGLAGAEGFVQWRPGWESDATGPGGWLLFWFKNTGVAGVLAVAGLLVAPPRERILALPFVGIFVACNLGQFQPWSHDSVKLFAWVELAGAVLGASALAKLWGRDTAGKALAVQAFLLAVATGTLALGREVTLDVPLMDQAAVQFASVVRERTPPGAVFLTSTHHNHPVPVLAGRTVVLGYKGWVWPHGVPFGDREVEVEAIYRAKPEARALLEKLGVDWVVVGPDEEQEFPGLKEAFFRGIALEPPVVSGPYRIYRVR
jgi:hypothetical protein